MTLWRTLLDSAIVSSLPFVGRRTMRRAPGRHVTSRALELLGTFDVEHQYLTLSQMAARAKMPPATAHRLAADLEAWGALQRDHLHRYQIGTRLWEVGQLAPIPTRLREIALPYMQDMYEKCKENIHFAVRNGLEVLYLAKLSGHQSISILSREGSRLPMHSTGVGKALLAFSSAEIIETYCAQPLKRCTQHTIAEPQRLRRELALTRDRGFSLTKEEMTLGSCSVAVPVFDAGNAVVAGFGIVVHSINQNLSHFAPLLRDMADEISNKMIQKECDPYPGFQHDLPMLPPAEG
jgi:DNA-binding IclR family transcriptional regulator